MRQTLSAPNLWPHLVKFQEELKRKATTDNGKQLLRKQSSTGFRENYRFHKVSSKVFNESPKKEEECNFIRY